MWNERMMGILFLRDCEDGLVEKKPESMENDAWNTLNKKTVTYIKVVVSNKIRVDIKGLTTACQVWEKLKSTYENTTPANQVHLMRKLVSMRLDVSKRATKHLSLFTGTLSQLQDEGLPGFDDKLKAIFLLMTLPESWETLVVSLSNSPNLTFDGVRDYSQRRDQKKI